MGMDDDLRRKQDVQLAILQQEFRDFRFEYEKDIARVQLSHEEMMKVIKSHDDFIRDIRPVYAKGMIAMGAAGLGTIGIAVNWLWRHVGWK